MNPKIVNNGCHNFVSKAELTRMHSSSMCTIRQMTVVPVCMLVAGRWSDLWLWSGGGGGWLTSYPGQGGRWLTSDPGQGEVVDLLGGGGWPLARGEGKVLSTSPPILQNDRRLCKHNLHSLRYVDGKNNFIIDNHYRSIFRLVRMACFSNTVL